MWLSNRKDGAKEEAPLGEFGTVTIGGEVASVYVAGERRDVSRTSPYGYFWTPQQGQTVALLHTGEGKKPCILGTESAWAELSVMPISAGDVYISVAEGCGIQLTSSGRIYLSGDIYANGILISKPEEEEEGA